MAQSRDFNVLCAFLALALAVGGAGLAYPMLEMLLELSALSLLAYLLLTNRSWQFNRLSRLSLLLLALTLALPLLQLVPLPPAVWHSLPGREMANEVDALMGWSSWRPLTLDVEATIRSFLRLLPAAAMFVGCLFLPAPERGRLLLVVICFAVAGAVLGMIQLASGGTLTPYDSGHRGFPVGFFVNRNHNAAFMLASMPLLGAVAAAAISRGGKPLPIIAAAACALVIFTVVVLGTTSRMGFALLPFGIAAFLFILFRRRAPFRLVLPYVGAIAAVLAYLFVSGGFTRTLSRFSSLDDSRFDYWTDINWALQHYGLAGTGIGTFDRIYQSAESLEAISPAIVNHAHNDYLEILLEGGAAGAALILLFLGLFAALLYVSWKSPPSGERALTRTAAATSIALLLLASAVDYPLRMPALSVAMAVLWAALLPTRVDARNRSRELVETSRSTRRTQLIWTRQAPLLLFLVVPAVFVVQAAMSARAVAAGRYWDAAQWAWWSTDAHEHLATEALLQGRPSEAVAEAAAAIRLSPIAVPAIRTIGLISVAEGAAVGSRMMQAALSLGWRDPLTQLWAIQAAQESREYEKALQRAEALFREQALVGPAVAQLLAAQDQPALTRLLAARLAENPKWRSTFFEHLSRLPAKHLGSLTDVLTPLNESKSPVLPAEVKPLLRALTSRGETADAQRIWGLVRRDSLITNGGFEDVNSNKRPLFPDEWTTAAASRRSVTLEELPPGSRNRSIRIVGSLRSTLLAQELMLSPGTYALSYDVRVPAGAAVTLVWEIRCVGSAIAESRSVTAEPTSNWARTSLLLTVPEQDCPIQKLALARTRATSGQQLWLDNVALVSAAR